jgi:antitoxin HicB
MTRARKRKAPRSLAEFSTLDGFLKGEGKLEEFQAIAIKEVLAEQIAEAMKARNISRSGLATKMKTSRSQIGRLLDPKDGMSRSRRCSVPHGWLGGHCGWNWSNQPRACRRRRMATGASGDPSRRRASARLLWMTAMRTAKTVVASDAKQSSRRADCFVARAARNDGSQKTLRIDVHFELEIALGLRPHRQPLAKIVRQVDAARGLHQ